MPQQEKERETIVTLLQKDKTKPKGRINRRKAICILVPIALCIGFSCFFILFFLFSDSTLSLRYYLSERLGIQLPGYEQPGNLESLLSTQKSNQIENIICQNCSEATANYTDAKVSEYLTLAESCWNTAWEILNDKRGWRLEKGTSAKTGLVYIKSYKNFGRVTRLKAYVDSSPEQLYKIFYTDAAKMSEWDSQIQESRIVEKISRQVDIRYILMAPLADGIIESRDYVDLRYVKEKDNATLQSVCATTHPDVPLSDDVVRAENKPGGIIIRPVKGNKNRALIEVSISVDIGGWIPQWAVDSGTSASMLNFLNNLKTRIRTLSKDA